jgi:hypothetical protein
MVSQISSSQGSEKIWQESPRKPEERNTRRISQPERCDWAASMCVSPGHGLLRIVVAARPRAALRSPSFAKPSEAADC